MSKLKKAIQRAEQARGEGWLVLESPAQTPTPPVAWPEEARKPVAADAASDGGAGARLDLRVGSELQRIGEDQKSAEAVRGLRTQVLGHLGDPAGRILLVTSAWPGEGKTHVALRLALGFAREEGQATVLVDANLRGSTLQGRLGMEGASGLVSVLEGAEPLASGIVDPGIPNLLFLPAGHARPATHAFASAKRVGAFLDELRTQYPEALTVVDGPPALGFPDALFLAPKADGVLLVVEAERVPVRDVSQAVESLRGHNLLGLAFNNWKGARRSSGAPVTGLLHTG
jgi:capsular exopolysaccharide synthesis family protein